MDAKDRLAYEAAMTTLQDTREECLRWLEDAEPVVDRRRRAGGPRPSRARPGLRRLLVALAGRAPAGVDVRRVQT